MNFQGTSNTPGSPSSLSDQEFLDATSDPGNINTLDKLQT